MPSRRPATSCLPTTEVDPLGRTNVFGGDEVVKEVGARVGNGNFPLDPGGVIRRVAYEVDDLKSFSLVTAERATGKTITRADFGSLSRPGSITPDLPGRSGRSPSPTSTTAMSPPARFKDKIVVVGPSAVSLQDIHPTSTGDAMSGAEIQANAIATALESFPSAAWRPG